ncbi:SLAM family member 5-like [Phalacrocorax aristotelis]|uniref:SLAM family member 5-like n=1 Tax=Phalacrocorax aristotelis TaxID=126867 RepID=UPI003F4C1254
MEQRVPGTFLNFSSAPCFIDARILQAWPQPQQVNGVLGGSVLLSPTLPPGRTVKEIAWSFSSGAGTTIQVAEFGPGGFKRPDPKDRFKERLEMFNETALKIRALERGDSGVYGARIKLHPALVEDQSFNLSVYEPLPDPEIQSWLLSKNPTWCHLMLQCHVPSGSRGTVAWMKPRGEPGGIRVHPLCSGVLQVEVQPSSPNTTLTCRAWHALEERSRPIDLASVCWSGGDGVRPGCWTAAAAALLLAAYAATLELPKVPTRHHP